MKLKEHYQKQQQKEFDEYVGYEEWLRDNITVPNEDEINDMEQKFCSSHLCKKSIYIPINTLSYQPLKGT